MGRGKRYDNTPKLNIKKVIATIIAIVVFAMFCISLKNLLTKDEKQVQEISTLTTYLSIYENGKWGVMNEKGEIVIEPTYNEMIIIPEKTTDIFVCTYDVDYNNETFRTKVLNANGEEVFKEYANIEVLQNTDGLNIWYEKDVLKFEKDGKYGLIDFKGKKILSAEYDNIYALDGIEKSIIIEKEGKKGLLLSSTGEIIIQPEYTDVISLTDDYKNGYIIKNSENKSGIISIDKKLILQPKYDEIKRIFENDCFVVLQDDKLAIIDSNDQIILDNGFDNVEQIDAENVIIIKNGKYGVISLEGKEIIPAEYEEIKKAISGQYYIAKKDGKYGVIGIDNTIKVDFNYETMNYIQTADFIEANNEDYTIDVFDVNLNKVLEKVIISEINIENGYLRIRKGEDYKYYNFKFQEKTNFDILSKNTLFLFKENGKYGYKNKSGDIIVDPIYDDAKEQNSFGYCAVKKNGLWGVLKSDGTVILKPSVNLDEYLYVDFISKWHMSSDVNLNTYTK